MTKKEYIEKAELRWNSLLQAEAPTGPTGKTFHVADGKHIAPANS